MVGIKRGSAKGEVGGSWLCSQEAFKVLCGDGYVPLAKNPEVLMCVNIIADLISSMTICLMKNTAKGDVRVKNGLSRKIDIEPYSLMTRKAWMFNIVRTLLLEGDGNQITVPYFDKNHYVDELVPVPPSKVSFVYFEGGYRVRVGKNEYEHDEMLHFLINPDPEKPFVGTGYRAALRDVLKGIRQANATKQKLMESPSPSIVVKVDGLAEEFASVEGRKKLRGQYIDASENGEPWFIPSEAFEIETIKPLTLNDLAIARHLELDKRTAAGLFRVPAFLVGVGTFNALEFNNFIATTLMPIVRNIEQELTRKLLISPDLYFRFNPRSLYSYSLTEIVAAGSAMVDRMAMRRNEWRDWIGIEPDDDMGDLLALENYIPADMLGKQKKLVGDA